MLPTPEWTVVPTEPVAGQTGPITIVDPEHSPVRPNVCIIPGSLVRSVDEHTQLLLLDEDDIANARLIAAAPQMLQVLEDLWSWAVQRGGWEASCWTDLDAVVAAIRGRPTGNKLTGSRTASGKHSQQAGASNAAPR